MPRSLSPSVSPSVHQAVSPPDAGLVPAIVADHLRADGVTRSYHDRTVLREVSLAVAPGARVGLIGENGVGKSTLLRIIAGAEECDRGTISRPARTGFLWQEVRFAPGDTIESLLEHALAEVRGIERELDAAAVALAEASDVETLNAASERYDLALAAAERADVWSADSRRDRVLAGLGVSSISLDRTLGEVSGGQRSRFAMAALLLRRPDALLLDEPTNHLDDAAVEFLQRQLVDWSGPVIFASHDRAFLDEVATALVDLDPTSATRGAGIRTRGDGLRCALHRRWGVHRLPGAQGGGAGALGASVP